MNALASDKVHHLPIRTGSEVTSISVTARIDYILRFSKHVVLVVDESTESYTKVARQYLATLSQANDATSVNVAYVSASAKLNDIQLRCRIIEQLFANTLFDPEQSLAVSLSRLAKQNPQAITILIEHAQSLSLQLKYELSQLVAIANKANIFINVVMFASTGAASEVSSNKSLFKDKLSMIEASSGQLINLSSDKFKQTIERTHSKLLVKGGIIACLIAICAIVVYLLLDEYDSHRLSGIATKEEQIAKLPVNNGLEEAFVNTTNLADTPSPKPLAGSGNKPAVINAQEEIVESLAINAAEEKQAIASHTEIAMAISLGNGAVAKPHMEPAQIKDILQALNTTEKKAVEIKKTLEGLNLESGSKPILEALPKINKTDPEISHAYYLAYSEGFVIQLAGFTNQKLWQDFVLSNQELNLFTYQKMLSDKTMLVVTSQVYQTRAEASAAMSVLPQAVVNRKPWLKSISTVNSEINTFTP